MKKLIMTAAVVACAAIVSAQVVSDNIVGYTKVNAVGGELTLAAINFDTGGAQMQDFIPPGTLPNTSAVFKWNKATGAYVSATLSSRGAWNNNFPLDLGDALWIQAAGASTSEVVFAGEVLSGDASIALPAGIVATGAFYPVDLNWQSTQMSADLANTSAVFVWNPVTQSYTSATKSSRGAWNANPAIGPANGFWINNAGSAINVTEPQKY